MWLTDSPSSPEAARELLAAVEPARLGTTGAFWPASPGNPASHRLLREFREPTTDPAVIGRVSTDGGLIGYVVHSHDRDDAAAVVRALRERGLSPGTSVTVALPVIVGRTLGEAEARLSRDPVLRRTRDPRRAGLLGTFSDAQAQLTDLILAGADGLRAEPAEEADMADQLAQLRAVAAGPIALLSQTRRSPAHQEVSR